MARKDVIILSTQDELYVPQSNGVHKEILFNKECFPIVLPHWKYSFLSRYFVVGFVLLIIFTLI